MSKIISDTIQGRSKDPNVNAGLTVAGVTTATGVVNASSDVRISGNINAGIATFTSIAGDGSALTGVANTDFIVSVAQTTSRLTVNSDANIVGVSTFTGTTTLTLLMLKRVVKSFYPREQSCLPRYCWQVESVPRRS